MPTNPEKRWSGEFGEEWTERNARPVAEMDGVYEERFGVTRTELMRRFVGDLDRGCRVLEVGANVGNQLAVLRELRFEKLYGIDIQREAIEWAHRERPYLDIIEGNVFEIPFKRNFFDLVFTTGLLIHIPPPPTGLTTRWRK